MGHCRVMTACELRLLGQEVITAPPRWIFTQPVGLGLGSVQHLFDPAAQ